MKHPHYIRTTILACTVSIALLLAGCAGTTTGTTADQSAPTAKASGMAERQAPQAGPGMERTTGEPAVFASTVDSASASSSAQVQLSTYDDLADVASNYTFLPLSIDLEATAFPSDEAQGLSIVKDDEGNIVIRNNASTPYEYVLTGTLAGTVSIINDEAPYMVTLSGVDITGTTAPAIQLKSTTKAFINVAAGSENSLSGSPDNDKKGALTADGDVIFMGTGSLTVTGTKKHAVKVDGTVRVSDGTLLITTTETAEGNGIHADDAFIMDDGDLTVEANGSVYGEEGKGIKVNGREADPENGIEAKGYLVVNGGTVTITSVGKAMTAGWKIDEDAETETTEDDPSPDLIINGGTVTIRTTGTPYEVSDEESLSPEGLEAKNDLVINGGLIQITATDDALNAGASIVINGGYIFAHSSQADAVDTNGTLLINGGTTVALGSQVPEMGLDSDDSSAFTYTGGTIVAMGGGGNNTPDNEATTGYVLTYGDPLEAGETIVLTDADGSVVVGFTVPSYYTSGSASLIASDAMDLGQSYTLYAGGTLSSSVSFNGLALGNDQTYDGGTEVGMVVISSTVSHLGAEIRLMGFGGAPGFGEGDGQFPEPPEGFPEGGRPGMMAPPDDMFAPQTR